jgi:hypothetical protein
VTQQTIEPERPIITFDDEKHKYTVNGEEVLSVTQALDLVTPKDALTWWGMRVGIAAVITLCKSGKLNWPTLAAASPADHIAGECIEAPEQGIKNKKGKVKTPIEDLVVKNRISTNHIRDEAGDRGTLIHDAINKIAIEDAIPDLDSVPEEFRPYVRAISLWWLEQEPTIVEQEIIVASVKHGYAGRYDTVCDVTDERLLVDFKTSKGTYEGHFEQLWLYEIARRELGMDPVDDMAIVRLDKNGTYEMVRQWIPDPSRAIHAIELAKLRQDQKRLRPKAVR